MYKHIFSKYKCFEVEIREKMTLKDGLKLGKSLTSQQSVHHGVVFGVS